MLIECCIYMLQFGMLNDFWDVQQVCVDGFDLILQCLIGVFVFVLGVLDLVVCLYCYDDFVDW